MERCINCESVYDLEDSDAELKECYCRQECQNEYEEFLKNPIEFV